MQRSQLKIFLVCYSIGSQGTNDICKKAYSKVNILYAIQLTALEFGLVIGAGS